MPHTVPCTRVGFAALQLWSQLQSARRERSQASSAKHAAVWAVQSQARCVQHATG